MSETVDLVVVGGGPAGSTAATVTAMDGHRVLLLEKEAFPRYQIGESLLPATVHGICPLLGVSEDIERAGFIRKRGGTFRWGANPGPWTFSFAVSRRMAGPTSYAYQVERAKFDLILLRNAARTGVDVRQEHQASDVIVENGRVCGVRYTDDGGNERHVRARFVLDASGNASRLHRRVGGRREYSPFFRNLALFGYFEGGRRLPEPNSGNILSVASDNGWFWYIPLSATLTSVGAVVKRELAARIQGDPEAAYAALIAECPMICELLDGAKRAATEPYRSLRVRKDYSYDHTVMWRPGMALVGDAACFIDPVFSSGVHLATYGALLAARSINSIFAGLVEEGRSLGEFEKRYRREFALFRDFLMAFYDTHEDEQSYFWRARKIAGHHGPAREAFADLVGGVVSADFAGMGRGRLAPGPGAAKATAKGMAAAIAQPDEYGDVPAMHGPAMLADVLGEGADLQLRAQLGEPPETDLPLFEGGLIPSADGRRWNIPAGARSPA